VQVIDQVRYALLSGADREVAYMLRAPVYLQLENIDNCKRDLSAILRSNPDHAAAKTLHRCGVPAPRPHGAQGHPEVWAGTMWVQHVHDVRWQR
jgi:hypothetical protein